MSQSQPYYDAKRPASGGRWVSIAKGKHSVVHTTHHTEAEAREVMGLTGGNTDPRYKPTEGA